MVHTDNVSNATAVDDKKGLIFQGLKLYLKGDATGLTTPNISKRDSAVQPTYREQARMDQTLKKLMLVAWK